MAQEQNEFLQGHRSVQAVELGQKAKTTFSLIANVEEHPCSCFIHGTSIDYLLCTSHGARCWEHIREQSRSVFLETF